MSFNKRPVRMEELRRMSMSIAHRGPDEDGFYLSPEFGMGMRRLSIIDLKTGKQPISNEDGSIWIVFNGEIYNFQELRSDLQRNGHFFATNTDTETIVHLYEEYGRDCVQHLRGMFAFAIWDERKNTLFLARDRIGIKPLYYGEIGGRLLFASEVKAILQVPGFEPELNWQSVSHLFTFLNTPSAESIVSGIHKLEPGHTLLATPGKSLSVEKYWDLKFRPDLKRTEQETIEQLRSILRESVRMHLVSDVPVGAFLSGGIDSSSVVAMMAGETAERISTFSVGFSEADFNELRYARMVAKQLGTKHHEVVLEPDATSIIEDLAWYLDEPFGDSSAIPTYMVSKLAAQHLKVVLSGDGGDELFAGYDKYEVERRQRRFDVLPSPLKSVLHAIATTLPEGMRGRNLLRHVSLAGAQRFLNASTLFGIEEKQKLFEEEPFRLMRGYDPWELNVQTLSRDHGHWLSALQYQDIKSYLPLDILTKVDRMSMAHSLETRVPLLDHKVVEFAATIPPDMKLRDGTRKYIFKQAMRGIIPDAIIDRPKRGFAIPLGRWFRGKLQDFIGDLLLSRATRERGIFRPAYLETLLKRHNNGRELDLHLWTLISFELWCRTFLDKRNKQTGYVSAEPARLPA
ncbi:MAG: asparagine synthase (glutamine-hydrolyzing) [Acidobacteria bacterium]|nr:asparagine synthase (glutamine-hydrolyzing) [Acidobacteriota bacterium]